MEHFSALWSFKYADWGIFVIFRQGQLKYGYSQVDQTGALHPRNWDNFQGMHENTDTCSSKLLFPLICTLPAGAQGLSTPLGLNSEPKTAILGIWDWVG
jgi:hypothetical protein